MQVQIRDILSIIKISLETYIKYKLYINRRMPKILGFLYFVP
jgi:hypothetical protein